MSSSSSIVHKLGGVVSKCCVWGGEKLRCMPLALFGADPTGNGVDLKCFGGGGEIF